MSQGNLPPGVGYVATDKPLASVNLAVRQALESPWFKRKSSDPNELSEQIRSNSIAVICSICGANEPSLVRDIKVTIRSTSNLIRHLLRHHSVAESDRFKEWLHNCRVSFCRSNPSEVGQTRLRTTTVTLQSQFDKLLTRFILRTMIPLSVVDDRTFRDLLEFLNLKQHGLAVISRRSLGRRIHQTYLEVLGRLREVLSRAKWVATTADIWSGGKRSFLGMTVHWIDEHYERQWAVLACRRFHGCHSFDRIAGLVQDIHISFDLPYEKIAATVTDNASNFIKAFIEFGVAEDNIILEETDEAGSRESTAVDELGALGDDDELFGSSGSYLEERQQELPAGDWNDETSEECEDDAEPVGQNSWKSFDEESVILLPLHIRCVAHTLSLCATSDVRKTLDAHADLRSLHDAIIGKCNILWRASQRPKSVEIIQAVTGRSLPRPVATRWNSLYKSLIALIEIRHHMITLKEQMGLQETLTPEDFVYIEEYLRCAKPIADGLDILQGEKTAFYGELLPTLLIVKKQLLELARLNLLYCLPLVVGNVQSLERRFGDIFDCFTPTGERAAIAALSLPKFKNAWFVCVSEIHQQHLLRVLLELIRKEIAKNFPPVVSEQVVGDPYYNFGSPSATGAASSIGFPDEADSILKRYLSDPHQNPSMLSLHPQIEPIFRRFNTPPPSSAQVERVFSYATMTNAPRNNRLSDEKFEQRVVLRVNDSFF